MTHWIVSKLLQIGLLIDVAQLIGVSGGYGDSYECENTRAMHPSVKYPPRCLVKYLMVARENLYASSSFSSFIFHAAGGNALASATS
jgi:hypothetical protein